MDHLRRRSRLSVGRDDLHRDVQIAARHADPPPGPTLRIIDQHGELFTTVPRASTGEISRFKACGKQATHADSHRSNHTRSEKAAAS